MITNTLYATKIVDNETGVEKPVKDLFESIDKPMIGFIDYNDLNTQTTPITLVPDVWTALTNDGLGEFTNKNNKPKGVTELLDTSTGFLKLDEVDIGAKVQVRNDFVIDPVNNNVRAFVRYNFGDSYTLEKTLGRLDLGGGLPYRFSLVTDSLYVGSEFEQNNPIKIEVKVTGDATVTNNGSVIFIN